MSFHTFNVGPSGRRFRRAVQDDVKDISNLLTWEAKRIFGDRNLAKLIDLSVLSISLVDEKNEVLGFVCLHDHPFVPGVDPAHWEFWIRNLYQRFFLARNTLFVHLMCFDASLSEHFVQDTMSSLFQQDYYLHQIVIVMPPAAPPELFSHVRVFGKYFVRVNPAEQIDDEEESTQYLYVAFRKDFCPRVKVRRAVEEDNDDIVEILDMQCTSLKELYGNYYISEILAHHPESTRQLLVVEDKELPVGLMCLSTNINYSYLNRVYELQPFCGLLKPTPLERESARRKNRLIEAFGDVISSGTFDPFGSMIKPEEFTLPELDNTSHENIPQKSNAKPPKSNRKVSGKSVVSFGKKIVLSRSLENIMNYHYTSDEYSQDSRLMSPSISQYTDISAELSMLAEDESMEYDIVNIDKSLLAEESYDTNLIASPVRKADKSSKKIPSFCHKRNSQHRRSKSLSFLTTTSEGPVYSGGPNAFMIELFAMKEGYDDRCGFDVLEIAFELYPRLEYCIIRLPTNHGSLPLLDHFALVSTRNRVCSGQALYIAHRNSVLGKFRVRKAEFCDIPQIASLLSNMDGNETLWTVEDSIVNENEHQAFVFLSGQATVGLGILEPSEETAFLRSKYNIDAYRVHRYHCNGVNSGIFNIKCILVSPAFEAHYRFFARDMLRQNGGLSLLWMTAYRNKWVTSHANSIVASMVPLMPRKRSSVERFHTAQDKKTADLNRNITPFALWYLNARLTSLPKVMVNKNVVVVGASATALSFLNTLLFSETTSYLTFSNITLVSPNGLPYVKHSKQAYEIMLPITDMFNDRYMKSTPYSYYVHTIVSTMCEIRRQEKYIVLTNGSKLYYDCLVLLCGQQYQHPDYFKKHWQKEKLIATRQPVSYVRLDNPSWNEFYLQSCLELPDNVFVVNDAHDASRALNAIREINTVYDKIIVYGCTLEAYCCISALLESGIAAENIVFVEPFPPIDTPQHESNVSLFCNEYVDNKVSSRLSNLGITIHRSCYFSSWSLNSFNNTVATARFLSDFRIIAIHCSALFYYANKGIDMNAFIAINDCGLVYDGALVIDSEFKTNDPCIYAAGPITKYPRQYHAESSQHKYYDSVEVGKMLGKQIRDLLDPFHETHVAEPEDNVKADASSEISETSTDTRSSKETGHSIVLSPPPKVPELTKPLVRYCLLPGGLEYLEVCSPGLKLPHKYAHSLGYTGIVMETFKDGYFKLQINKDLMVEAVTCLTSDTYPVADFAALFGCSVASLNNIHIRYETKMVDNFFVFFSAPWTFLLYHDCYAEFMDVLRNIVPAGSKSGMTLKEELLLAKQLMNKPSVVSELRSALLARFQRSPFSEATADFLLHWLRDRDSLLPMYAQRTHAVHLQRNNSSNVYFKKKCTTLD